MPNILIVEPDLPAFQAMPSLLTPDHPLDFASSSEEAVQKLQAGTYALAVPNPDFAAANGVAPLLKGAAAMRAQHAAGREPEAHRAKKFSKLRHRPPCGGGCGDG